ncbi:MAG: hypothetical protein ACRYG4_27950 [Janthinobacterium lividum]
MVDPELRSSPFSIPRELFERHRLVGRARSAALFITIYLGLIIGFGAVMAGLLHAAGG